MNAEPDYYHVLRVEPAAPAAVIHASFRTLMQRLKTMDDAHALEQAALLTEAYAVLSNQKRRAVYDSQRQRAVSQSDSDFAATEVLRADR